MEPIENEPKAWDENQQSNANDFGGQTNKETKAPVEIDTSNSSMAANAAGNMLDEEDKDDEMPPKEVKTDDPRGFMGDFAEPQHDD